MSRYFIPVVHLSAFFTPSTRQPVSTRTSARFRPFAVNSGGRQRPTLDRWVCSPRSIRYSTQPSSPMDCCLQHVSRRRDRARESPISRQRGPSPSTALQDYRPAGTPQPVAVRLVGEHRIVRPPRISFLLCRSPHRGVGRPGGPGCKTARPSASISTCPGFHLDSYPQGTKGFTVLNHTVETWNVSTTRNRH